MAINVSEVGKYMSGGATPGIGAFPSAAGAPKKSSGWGLGKAGSFLNPSDESRASATRFAGMLGDIFGSGGKKSESGNRMAGSALADYTNLLNSFKSKEGGIQSMGDDMFLYTPTREPDFAEYEGTYRKGVGGVIGNAVKRGFQGFAAGGPIGAVIGAGGGALEAMA